MKDLKEIIICKSHFKCDWYGVQGGGQRPKEPPSIFPGVPKSCLKQTNSKPRTTTATSPESRSVKERKPEEEKDRINDFEDFSKNIEKRYKDYNVIIDQENVYLSLTDKIGQKVLQFIHFKKITSKFGFLFLERAERNGVQVAKRLFPLQKNSLISKWTQVAQILSVVTSYEPSNEDLLSNALESLKLMTDFHDSPHFQFIIAQ